MHFPSARVLQLLNDIRYVFYVGQQYETLNAERKTFWVALVRQMAQCRYLEVSPSWGRGISRSRSCNRHSGGSVHFKVSSLDDLS